MEERAKVKVPSAELRAHTWRKTPNATPNNCQSHQLPNVFTSYWSYSLVIGAPGRAAPSSTMAGFGRSNSLSINTGGGLLYVTYVSLHTDGQGL
jgi:hypothetical protein